MNKKGFTLIELLGIIIIIAIIIAIVIPNVASVLEKSKKTIKDIQINKILDSAYDYTLKYINFLPEANEVKYITLNELKKENLIDSDIKFSNSDEEIPNDLVISIKNKNYSSNTGKYFRLNGDYLYTVEMEFRNSNTYYTNRPTIDFTGHEENPIVMNLDIGEEYNPLKYTATSVDGTDLTGNVVENITYNSKNVNKVDTKVAGIYYVNYSVVDKDGYSNVKTVNIIVFDNEKPVLNIPDDVTISIDTTSYDLYEGVSCKDNSNVCDIKINRTIKFGVEGKNEIEYIASDPSGNTDSKTRVITVR